tara:strand:+ start:2869 stop:3078 length:210 start_codon:yes stop_codon:yes gene_type:complete
MGSQIQITLDESVRSKVAKALLIEIAGKEKSLKYVAMELIEREFIKLFDKKRLKEIQLQFNQKDKLCKS